MHEFNQALATLGGVLLLLGLSSGFIKNRLYISEPIVSMLAGIIVGPHVLGLFDLAAWGRETLILQEVARLTLAVALINVAFQLPDRFLFVKWQPVAILLGLVMPLMWLSGGLLTWWILEIPLGTALLIGAVVTPTDPVLAASIVNGKMAEEHLSDDLRYTIIAESGANDALAYPIVMLMILLNGQPAGDALDHWFLHTILWEIGVAVILGILIGYLSGHLLVRLERHPLTEMNTLITVSLSLAVAVTGCIKLIGSEGLLAVFISGILMNSIVTTGEFEEGKKAINESAERFFEIPVFLLFGIALPWDKWGALGSAGWLLVGALLLLRRIPAILLTFPLMRHIGTWYEALFMGWFGPIGIAALYYAMLSLNEHQAAMVWNVASLIIFGSILVHGTTATPLTRFLGRKTGRVPRA